jgi:sec-independent protein translocase protein TatA
MNSLDSTLIGIGMPGPMELVLIIIILLVVFGANRLPQLGDALGKGIRNFKKSFTSDETETEANRVDVKQVSSSEPIMTESTAEKAVKKEES